MDAETVLKRLDLEDDQRFRVGDTLDVKASILLVIVTFLAAQTTAFLTQQGPGAAVQAAAALVLAVAGGLAFVALWPRDYETEAAESLDGWVKEVQAYYADDPVQAAATVHAGRIRRTTERIERNGRVNDVKSRLITWAFSVTAIAFLLNLGTLVWRAWP